MREIEDVKKENRELGIEIIIQCFAGLPESKEPLRL